MTIADNYKEGGARGEVARGTAEYIDMIKGAISKRSMTGTRAALGNCVVTALAVEQIGQTCDAEGAAVKSQQ